ncbi:hypothetical protein MASR2M78_16610 [Treponema sp.]
MFDSLETVVKGLGLSILDFSVSRHRDTVQVRLTVYKKGAVGLLTLAQRRKMLNKATIGVKGLPGIEKHQDNGLLIFLSA